MKKANRKEQQEPKEFRSFADFRKRFYPQPVEEETPEQSDAEAVGTRLAKESLNRLQAALSSK